LFVIRSVAAAPELSGERAPVEEPAAPTPGRHTEQARHTPLGAHVQAAGAAHLDRVPPARWQR